jgi:hypothetical protein
MRHVIAFVGFHGAGKNTAAAALIPRGFVQLSFSDALKDTLAAIFCWDRALLEGTSDKGRPWREQIDSWWAEKLGIPHFTPRWAMTHIGTAVMRQQFSEDIWVRNVECRLQMVDRPVILPDARFPNEIAMARAYGAQVIRIQRGAPPLWLHCANEAAAGSVEAAEQLSAWGIHESEWRWLNQRIDHTIVNDDSIEQLHREVQTLLTLPQLDTPRNHGQRVIRCGTIMLQ